MTEIKPGSPAWAGIDLVFDPDDEMAQGFPRVGGDRPSSRDYAAPITLVPPRGRG